MKKVLKDATNSYMIIKRVITILHFQYSRTKKSTDFKYRHITRNTYYSILHRIYNFKIWKHISLN
jgi:hypothetical protein